MDKRAINARLSTACPTGLCCVEGDMKYRFLPPAIDRQFEFAVISYYGILFTVFMAMTQLPLDFEKATLNDLWRLVDVFAYSTGFVAINMLLFKPLKDHLLVRAALIIVSAMVLAAIRYVNHPGIIDPVWYFIMSTACAFTIVLYRGDFLKEQVTEVSRHVYDEASEKMLDYIRDSYRFMLRTAFQAYLALGASLGVSMSILFRQGYEDVSLKYLAIKMLAGFVGISFAFGYWIGLPLGNGLLECHYVVKDMEGGASLPTPSDDKGRSALNESPKT